MTRSFTRTLALVCALALAPVAFAGHSFTDPVAITGGGDLWVSDGLDVDGTCIFDGICTFNAAPVFSLGAALTGDLTISDDLVVTDDISCDSLYVATHANIGDSLHVANNATVGDTLAIGGELKGGRCILCFGQNATDQTGDVTLKGAGYTGHLTSGYMMTRSGSIVGASFMFNIDSYTPVATIEMDVSNAGGVLYTTETLTIAGTGVDDVRGTAGRGVATFSAGDYLRCVADITGTVQYDPLGAIVEVQFND